MSSDQDRQKSWPCTTVHRQWSLVQTWDEFILEDVHGANSRKDQLEKCNSVPVLFPEDKILVSRRSSFRSCSLTDPPLLQVLFLPAERGRAVPAPSPDITFQSATHSSGRGEQSCWLPWSSFAFFQGLLELIWPGISLSVQEKSIKPAAPRSWGCV